VGIADAGTSPALSKSLSRSLELQNWERFGSKLLLTLLLEAGLE
jgi:hypothetical protein